MLNELVNAYSKKEKKMQMQNGLFTDSIKLETNLSLFWTVRRRQAAKWVC